MFTAKGINDQNLLTFAIPDYSVVKVLKGTEQGANSGNWLHKLKFKDIDRKTITKVEPADKKPYAEIIIDNSEKIIGIYGTKDQDSWINQLGFIVW